MVVRRDIQRAFARLAGKDVMGVAMVAIIGGMTVIGRFLWKRGDGNVIDGSINGVAMGIIPFFTRLAGRAQSGYIFTYAFAMVIGIAVLVTWMSMTGGAE